MNRRTNTALKIAGIALALSGLGGVLVGCGGSDSDGGPAADAASDASSDAASDAASDTATDAPDDGFCEKLSELSTAAAKATPDDTTAAIQGVKDWVAEMEDTEAPSELGDDEREGLEILVATFREVDDDASLEDLQKLGTEISKADTEKVNAFSAWTTENCTPIVPSDDAS